MSELLSPLNVALDDLFRITITIPPDLRTLVVDYYAQEKDIINDTALHFNIFEPTLPDIERPEVQVLYQGGTYNVASHIIKVDGSIDFQFDIDSLFLNYISIFTWLNLQADQTTIVPDSDHKILPEKYFQTKQDAVRLYKGTVNIEILDKQHNPILEYEFQGAFPKKLSAPKLGYRSSSATTLKSSASFAFDRCVLKLNAKS